MSLEEKVADLRWHVATTGHQSFAIERGYAVVTPNPAMARPPEPDDEGREREVWDDQWRLVCGGDGDQPCPFERTITESEIAVAGRYDLTDAYAIGALVESIKLEKPRQAPKVWEKVGALDIGEDP